MKLLPSASSAILSLVFILLAAAQPFAFAGESAAGKNAVTFATGTAAPVEPFKDARRPITNFTLFDLTIPQTHIHPVAFYHNLPNTMNTALGQVPVGGDAQLYAVQIEWALNERLSINATKDGYVVLNPDATLASEEGFANIAAGIKYAWLYKPEQQLASNVQLIFEAPLGNSDVFQGEGDGVFIPSASVMKIWNRWQFIDQLGFKVPIDSDAESTMMYNSFHASYAATSWFFPTFEVNWFHVLDDGDGRARFGAQAGGGVPAIANFEGNDVFNFGAVNGSANPDLLTFGVGFRARCPKHDNIDIGFAYEFPITEESDSIFKNRFIVDAIVRF